MLEHLTVVSLNHSHNAYSFHQWKAAKEELHAEEEEERESALEKLEKKRQREIEVCYCYMQLIRHIASGIPNLF